MNSYQCSHNGKKYEIQKREMNENGSMEYEWPRFSDPNNTSNQNFKSVEVVHNSNQYSTYRTKLSIMKLFNGVEQQNNLE